MKNKIGAIIFAIVGIFLMAYPKIAEMHENSQQERLIQEWRQSFQNIDMIDNEAQTDKDIGLQDRYDSNYMDLDYTTIDDLHNDEIDIHTEAEIGNEATDSEEKVEMTNAEGLLIIDKIDLSLPILHGATQKNLKTTVASIENTGKAGEVGNYAIAGHRNRTYGRNFNRLDEVEIGDKVEVNNGDQQFKYTVVEKLYVKPEDVWVLDTNGEDKEITLVTCHPMVNPTHRLIIKGKIEE